MVTIPLASKNQLRHIVLAIFTTYTFTLAAGISSIIFYEIEWPIAVATILSLLSFYLSPLLNLAKVIKTKNSASIYLPLAAVSVLTSVSCKLSLFLWLLGLSYGFVIENYWIWGPNILTLSFSVVSLVSRLILPAVIKKDENVEIYDEKVKENV